MGKKQNNPSPILIIKNGQCIVSHCFSPALGLSPAVKKNVYIYKYCAKVLIKFDISLINK